jgi:hypothetical protein
MTVVGGAVSFKQFWPLYLQAHQRSATRAMHYLATAVGIGGAIAALITGVFWLFPLGIGLGYAIAVMSHWVFEGNQPLILVSPFWGAVSDMRMCYLALTGRLEAEAARQGVMLEQPAKQDDIAPVLRD